MEHPIMIHHQDSNFSSVIFKINNIHLTKNQTIMKNHLHVVSRKIIASLFILLIATITNAQDNFSTTEYRSKVDEKERVKEKFLQEMETRHRNEWKKNMASVRRDGQIQSDSERDINRLYIPYLNPESGNFKNANDRHIAPSPAGLNKREDVRAKYKEEALERSRKQMESIKARRENDASLKSASAIATSVNEPDSLALVALYNATDGPNWTNNTNWLVGPVSTWYGVTVENASVVAVELWNNHLNGIIPPEIGQLINLQILNLGDNHLTGTIPSEIGQLSNLQYLDITNNQLTGNIPSSIGELNNLYGLYLYNNQLSGAFPAELGGCTNLRTLFVGYNNFSGVIPAALCNLPLEWVYFEGNLFDADNCPTIQCLLDNGVNFDG